MNALLGLRLIGAILAAVCVTFATQRVVRPAGRLSGRVRPYTAASRSLLGQAPEHIVVANIDGSHAIPTNFWQRFTRPFIESITATITRLFGTTFDDNTLALKLRQADILSDIPE